MPANFANFSDEYSTFAVELAKKLNELDEGAHWRWAPDIDSTWQLLLVNANAEGEKLYISQAFNQRGAARASAQGALAQAEYQVHWFSVSSPANSDPDNPEASFALSRPTAAIAKDIYRKVLPGYRELRKVLSARVEASRKRDELEAATAKRLSQLAGGRVDGEKFDLPYSADKAYGHGSVVVRTSGEAEVYLDLKQLSVAQAERVLRALIGGE